MEIKNVRNKNYFYVIKHIVTPIKGIAIIDNIPLYIALTIVRS